MFKFIQKLEESILCLLLVSMTLLVFVETVARFGFNTGITWSQELTLTLSGWFVLFGASYGIKVGAHIGVDVFVKMLPNKIHRAVSVFAILLCLYYCGLFLYGSWGYIAKLYKIGIEMDDMPIPLWVSSSILLFGFTLLTIRILQLLWHVLRGEADGFLLPNEARESVEKAKDLGEHPDAAEESR